MYMIDECDGTMVVVEEGKCPLRNRDTTHRYGSLSRFGSLIERALTLFSIVHTVV